MKFVRIFDERTQFSVSIMNSDEEERHDGQPGQAGRRRQRPRDRTTGDGAAAAAPGSDEAVARQGARPREGEVRHAKNPPVDALEHVAKSNRLTITCLKQIVRWME